MKKEKLREEICCLKRQIKYQKRKTAKTAKGLVIVASRARAAKDLALLAENASVARNKKINELTMKCSENHQWAMICVVAASMSGVALDLESAAKKLGDGADCYVHGLRRAIEVTKAKVAA